MSYTYQEDLFSLWIKKLLLLFCVPRSWTKNGKRETSGLEKFSRPEARKMSWFFLANFKNVTFHLPPPPRGFFLYENASKFISTPRAINSITRSVEKCAVSRRGDCKWKIETLFHAHDKKVTTSKRKHILLNPRIFTCSEMFDHWCRNIFSFSPKRTPIPMSLLLIKLLLQSVLF